jgi:hypothetical protein
MQGPHLQLAMFFCDLPRLVSAREQNWLTWLIKEILAQANYLAKQS